MKEKGQLPYSSKTEIEKKKPKILKIDLDGHIIQEQTLLSAYKQNMHKAGKLAKKYLLLVLLLIQTTVSAQVKGVEDYTSEFSLDSIPYNEKTSNEHGHFYYLTTSFNSMEEIIQEANLILFKNGIDLYSPFSLYINEEYVDEIPIDDHDLLYDNLSTGGSYVMHWYKPVDKETFHGFNLDLNEEYVGFYIQYRRYDELDRDVRRYLKRMLR